MISRLHVLGVIIAAALAGAAGGYWWANPGPGLTSSETASGDLHSGKHASRQTVPASPIKEERRVLYWYDPMYPSQHFDQPGKSPFMDMELVPRYADAVEETGTVRIDPGIAQNLGMRVEEIVSGTLPNRIDAVGTLQYDGRDLSVVQARTAGYVERVYGLAPGDVIAAGAPLADLLVPDWAGAQTEFLALRRHGDEHLVAAARVRLRLLGMPEGLIARVERTGAPQTTFTATSPSAGVIDTLEIRAGMTVAAGQTLATVKGIDRVWLEAAVPEAQGSQVRPGDAVEATLAAYAGERLHGNVIAVLPVASADTRTISVRVQLDNPDGRLRPGMFATVQLRGAEEHVRPLVPVEALIRTGKRTLVMQAEDDHRYRPVEIVVGREADGRAEVLSGLRVGDRVVVSGQFLIDSEASLTGVLARAGAPPSATPETLHETDGTVVSVSDTQIELDHVPFATLKMAAMQMPFQLANAGIARGIEPGQRVRVRVRETDRGLIVERIERIGTKP